MKETKRLILENRAWAKDKLASYPDYFKELSSGQSPKYFWIGCSDSRVVPAEMFNVSPGEMFTHSNVANQIQMEDANSMSALEYAVGVLKVDHVIVCGHTKCGGVQAAYENYSEGKVGEWIDPIKQTYQQNKQEVETASDKLVCLSELNVKAQIAKLKEHDAIKKAWSERQKPILHGWIFELETGLIRDVMTEWPK